MLCPKPINHEMTLPFTSFFWNTKKLLSFSSFYAWLDQVVSLRAVQEEELRVEVAGQAEEVGMVQRAGLRGCMMLSSSSRLSWPCGASERTWGAWWSGWRWWRGSPPHMWACALLIIVYGIYVCKQMWSNQTIKMTKENFNGAMLCKSQCL